MMPAPFVSVVVPTCFREAILMECLDSLVAQTYQNFEILVVDQADGKCLGERVRQRYPELDRLRYFHAHRAGAARARNLALTEARGHLAAFIDDDAVASPGWLQGLVDALSSGAAPALVAGRIFPIWPKKRPAWFPKDREFLLGLYDLGEQRIPLPPDDLPIAANMAGRIDIIKAHGGFDENLGFNYFRRENMSGGDEANIGAEIREGGHALVHRQKTMIGGEEAILGRRIKDAGYRFLYEPTATVHHRVSAHKLTRSYLLKRHFWEGVSVAKQLNSLGQMGNQRLPHYRYHGREIAMAAARFLLPGYANIYRDPAPVIRMRSLARIAYSWGVICTVSEKGFWESTPPQKAKCASA